MTCPDSDPLTIQAPLSSASWVPMDPTWSLGTLDEKTDPNMSLVGSLRDIPLAEYYFGKNDPYRIPMYKDWNVELTPRPRTPGAEVHEMYFIGHTERSSGVRSVTYGWEGIEGMGG